jgi:hypothetical protein
VSGSVVRDPLSEKYKIARANLPGADPGSRTPDRD